VDSCAKTNLASLPNVTVYARSGTESPACLPRDEQTAKKLAIAFKRGDMGNVRSFHRNELADDTCWFAGDGWWLSTAPNG